MITKKRATNNLVYLSILLTCCLFLIIVKNATATDTVSSPMATSWGMTQEELQQNLGDTIKYIVFKPKEKPDYKNKIMSFITAIDESFASQINIVRTLTIPQVDYLFVKGKLYTTLEDWKVVGKAQQDSILQSLKKNHGDPSVQKDGNFYIFSFNTPVTKVLFYKLVYADGTAKCKVYYYTNKLFRMLIMDQ